MALPFDQIEALAHKLAVADIGADKDEQVTPNAKAVVGELEQKDLVTVVEIAVEIAEYKQEKLEQCSLRSEVLGRVIDKRRDQRGSSHWDDETSCQKTPAAGKTRLSRSPICADE